MRTLALAYAHVSSNIGDVALNAGLASALTHIEDARIVPVLARAPHSLLEAAGSTFPGLASSPHVLRSEDLTPDLLAHYCESPESYFEDLGLQHCEGVLLHAGEHLFTPADHQALHPLALWRILPILAAKATGRSAVILPSTFGPFNPGDPLADVIHAALANADAIASREPYSARLIEEQWGLKATPLIDLAYLLPVEIAEEHRRSQASVAFTMRLEGAGLRTGARLSEAHVAKLKEGGFASSEAYQYAQALIGHLADAGTRVTLYVQGRSDEALQAALHEWAADRYGDLVRLERPLHLDEYRESIRKHDALVGARFHACILAMGQKIPAFGVHMPSHGHKMLGLFEQLDISDRCVTVTSDNVLDAARATAAALATRGGETEHWERLEALRGTTVEWLRQALARPASPQRSDVPEALGLLARIAGEAAGQPEGGRRGGSAPHRGHPSPRRASSRLPWKRSLRSRLAGEPLREYSRMSGGERLRHLSAAEARDMISQGWTDRSFPTISVMPPINWDVALENRSWNYQLHSWEFFGNVLASPSLASDPEILAWCADVVRDWHRNYPTPDYSTEFPWYDMAIAWRTHRLAHLLSAIARSSLDDTVFDETRLVLDQHLEAIADDRNFKAHSNHGFYVAAAQLSASAQLRAYPGISRHRDMAVKRLRTIMEGQFAVDGMHKEHSPDYHRMVLGSLRELVAAHPADLADLEPLVERSEDALAWLVAPDGTLAMFGDTPRRSVTAGGASHIRGKALVAVMTDGEAGAFPPETARAFPESGYWCVRDRWPARKGEALQCSYLAQAAGFHSRAHKQADDLSLVWWDRGAEILVDAGRYGYLDRLPAGHELWEQGFYYGHPARVYVESTRAHNTVEIDGRSYQRRGVKPYGSALKAWGTTDGAAFSVCDVTQLGSVEHRRVVAHRPGSWLLVVDLLADRARGIHDYLQGFHFAPELEVVSIPEGYRVNSPSWDTPLHAVATADADALSLQRGAKDPLLGWISRTDNVLEPAWSAGWTAPRGSEATFAAFLHFGGEPGRVTRDKTQNGLEFTAMAGGTTVILRAADGGASGVSIEERQM